MGSRTVTLLVLAALIPVAVAQDATPPPAAATPPSAAPPPAQSAEPPARSRSAVDDDEFIPSQELSADEAVTFPVDI